MMKLRTLFGSLTVPFFLLLFNPMTSSTQANYVYWTDVRGGKIQRANLDGANVETLITRGKPIWNIALDLSAGKMYWTVQTVDNRIGIQRANLNGMTPETLVIGRAGGAAREGIALDISKGKMYWSAGQVGVSADENKIQRANLDGSNIEDFITGLDGPHQIALDFNDSKIYWTDWNAGKIQRANFNGSQIEDIVVGLSTPAGIALDSLNGQMYWAERGSGTIQRANLDGTNIETLVTGITHAFGIALSIPQSSTSVPPRVNLNFTMPSEVSTGEEFTAALNITDAVDLAGVQFDLHFNPVILEATDIHEGDLLTGEGTFFQVLHLATVPGEISGIRIARIGGVDGSGILLKIVFKAKAVGVSELTVRNLKVGTSAGAAIPTNLVSGKVEVGSRPDVTGDGTVNILDLVLVSRHFGPAEAAPPGVDINGDGEVDIFDLILLAQHLSTSNTSAAPARFVDQTGLDAVKIQGWLSAAYIENDGSLAFARGIAKLEQLLARIVPTETAVYTNYPNPFNPETWFPYQLAVSADVTFSIHSASGQLVRRLALGHKLAGTYQTRNLAAYWDGKNSVGEPVASGIYFYTLTADDFTATRKMLIRK